MMRPASLDARWFLVVGLSALGACSGATPPPGQIQHSSLGRATPASLSSADVLQASSDDVTFALNLYAQVRTGTSNTFYSPWSITQALAMTYMGAQGDTATQMAHAMSFSLPADRLASALNAIDLSVSGDASNPAQGSSIEWRSANQLFAQTGKTFLASFLDPVATSFGAGVSLLDLSGSPEPSRTAINAWVSAITDGHIPTLLPQGFIKADTRLVLTNAVYFHAAWLTKFDPTATHAGTFQRVDGSSVTAQMMNATIPARVGTGAGWTAVEVPYANHATTLLAIVPDAGTFSSFESSLTSTTLAAAVTSLADSRIQLTMPRFTMQASFDLSQTLSTMGMPVAFSPAADFSGMDGQHDLLIQDVVHQAWVDVSESGTTAAAATAVGTGANAVETPQTVTIDRPFVFFIRDNPSGALLFVGRVMDPTAS